MNADAPRTASKARLGHFVSLPPGTGLPSIDADPLWGVTVAWTEASGIRVQRVDFSGTKQWYVNGVAVSGT